MKNKVIKILCIAVLSILFVAYFYQMIKSADINIDSIIETEHAVNYTYSENISANGIVVRDEELLSYATDDVLYYTVNDGDTVSANSTVAYVFSDEESALNYKRIEEINDEIAVLEELNNLGQNSSTDFSAIDKEIKHNLDKLISCVNSNSLRELSSCSDDLVFSINQRQIITGEVEDFNSQISALQSERTSIDASGVVNEVVTNTKAGYFVSTTDGYEKTYNYDNIKSMTVSQFDTKKKPVVLGDDVIGKIVIGPNWFVACKITADDAISLSHANSTIRLSFPNSSCHDIPARCVAVNQVNKQSDAIAVFACNYMNSAISHLRNESVLISINNYSGLRISKDAIHDDFVVIEDSPTDEKKKVQGVYVLTGNELVFKEISIIYSANDFVIIDDTPDNEKLISGETVSLNDSIVVRGEDLYAGKVIE